MKQLKIVNLPGFFFFQGKWIVQINPFPSRDRNMFIWAESVFFFAMLDTFLLNEKQLNNLIT